MNTVNVDNLRDLIGVVAEQDFHAASASTQAELLEWIDRVREMSDSDFGRECEQRIYDEVVVNRFRGNFYAEHCRGSAVYHEAQRRHRAAGHDEDCHSPTIYSRAHARLMRDHGHTPTPDGECHCKGITR